MQSNSEPHHDLTQGPIYPHVMRLGVPAALGMVFNTLYNLTDNWFAGQISDVALSGLSIASVVFAIFLALGMGLQGGTSAVVAIDLGSKNNKKVKEWINCSFGISWFLSAVILALGLLYAKDLLNLIGNDPEVESYAWDYTSVILYGNVFFNITSMAAGALIAHGNTKTYRNVLIYGFFANWILNPLFIYVFDFGVAGLAWSTLLIKMMSSVYLLKVLKDEVNEWSVPAYDKQHWLELLKQILPASMNMLTIVIGGFITIYFISKFGDDPVAGYSVGIRIEQLLLMPALGVNAAVMALVGQSYGAGKLQRVHVIYHKSIKLSALISLVFIPIMIFLSPLMMTQFTNTSSIVDVGVYYLRADAFAFFGYMVLFCSVAVLQAIKQPIYPMVIGILRQMVFPGIAFYVLIEVMSQSLHSIFWAIVSIVIASAIFTFGYTERQLKLLKPAN